MLNEVKRSQNTPYIVFNFGPLRPQEYCLAQLCHHTYMKTTQEILVIFIKKIKEFMAEKNFNIKEFAEFVNVPRRTVSGWIANQKMPRIDYLYQIAEKLNCTIDYLVGREEF